MSPFVPGQRWLSTAEPELGLGTVLRADARQVQVLFAATATMRVYAVASAPLLRAAFRVGDKVAANGERFVVEEVEEREGILHYRGAGHRLPEGALDDVQDISKADDRLLGGRVDRPTVFDLRVEALERRAQARRDAGFGALSARIDLIPHQLRVAEIASERRPPRVLLADEVGLGKTIEACTVIARMIASGRAGRVLVLLPEALVYQWFVELRRRFNLDFAIFDEERAEAIDLAGDGRNPFLDEQLVITDLAFLTGKAIRAQAAVKAGWDLLVVDEAHHLAWAPEGASREYQLVEALARRAPGVLLLTATPEQLGRSGHFARLRLLDPARFHDLEAFQDEGAHYVALSQLAGRLDGEAPLDAGDLEELVRLLGPQAVAPMAGGAPEARTALLRQLVDRHGTGRVMFRNRRAVVGGFPRRAPRVVVLPEPADPALAEHLVEEFLGDIAAPPFAPPLSYLDDPRLAWLTGLLDAHPGEKFLLITRCQAKLHALEEALRLRSGVPVARFHEGLGIVQRDRAAAHFADPGGARLLLCTEIGSEGRNFQFAQHLVLWDLPLDPDLLEQRIGRLDRIGQRGDVNIHACVFDGSAQHALLRWLDEGLGALGGSPEDGRELLKRFGERVVAAALAQARGEPESAAALDALVEETAAAHAQLAAAIAEGRDRLLELNTRHAPGAERLLEALAGADADRGAGDFILRLFEHFGVDVEEQGPQLFLLDPEMLTTEAFPGLDQPRQATFHRPTALAREDVLFLRLDHPMVVGALDLLLGSEIGNAAFAVDDTLPPRTALLEAVFVLECIAPPKLGADRFLPPQPLRCVVDTRLADRGEWRPDGGALGRSGERNIDVARYRKHLAALLPPMLGACRKQGEARAAALVDTALAAARGALRDEIDRLEALARVNPSVRASEIDAARDELAMLEELLPQSSLRLDSLRFVASVDFLSLRS
jgi:ATP-dependent helicase HepA